MNYNQIKKICEELKHLRPEIVLVVGGPHPSALPKETLQEISSIDFVIMGEGEKAFPVLLKALEEKKTDFCFVPNLVWRKGLEIVCNPIEVVDDLDSLGMPAWDLLKPESYPIAPHGSFVKQFPVAPIIITRGCPFSCIFCAGHVVSGKKLRSHSLEFVLKEIELLVKRGIKEIHIEDDNFTFNKQFVTDFCNALIQKNWGISWACPNGIRADTLDKELLLLMKKSGLYSVSIGIESGSDRILALCKKSLTTAKIREKTELISSVGLNLIGFVMMGFPTETREEMQQTVDFVCSLPLKRINISCLQLFPGTKVYEDLLTSGEIEKVCFEKLFLFETTYAPKGISIEELKKIRRHGLMQFYFRPKIVWALFSEIKSFKQFFFVLRRGLHWLS